MIKEASVQANGFRWLVVVKPSGMIVHQANGEEDDLLSWAKEQLTKDPELAKSCSYDPQYEIHPIHRLDREVSGLVLLALDKKRAQIFHKQFEQREVEKAYLARVKGRLDKLEEEGEWKWKLTKKLKGDPILLVLKIRGCLFNELSLPFQRL